MLCMEHLICICYKCRVEFYLYSKLSYLCNLNSIWASFQVRQRQRSLQNPQREGMKRADRVYASDDSFFLSPESTDTYIIL